MNNYGIYIDIITSVATVSAVIYAARQLRLSREIYIREKDKESREKAIEFADCFQKLIAKELGFVSMIYKGSELSKYIDKISYKDIKCFNEKELKYNFGGDYETVCAEVKKLSVDYTKIAEAYMYYYDLSFEERNLLNVFISTGWEARDLNNLKGKIETLKNIDITDDKIDVHRLKSEVKKAQRDYEYNCKLSFYKDKMYSLYEGNRVDLLNKLEMNCMYFSNKLADEEVVYQSLHQLYLIVVKSLYFYIAHSNKDTGADKYYVNIIKLYNEWQVRYEKKRAQDIEMDTNVHMKSPLK